MKPHTLGSVKSSLFAFAVAVALPLGLSAASIGLNWVGAGTPVTDPGGAFGVPLAGWNNLSGAAGSMVVSPPTGGALTVTWSTGGGVWQSGATFPGYSAGENQVFSGNMWAGQNDPDGARAIVVSVAGMDSVASGSYTLELMAAIDGPVPPAEFRPAYFAATGEFLHFGAPVHSGASLAAVTTNLTLSGDLFEFSLANDNVTEGGVQMRAELSGMVLTFTPAPAPAFATQPQSQTVAEGGTATFTVAVTGSAPFSYQWFWDEAEMFGESAPTLRIAGVTAASAGSYRVKVTDSAGRYSYSSAARLTVAPPGPGLVYDWSTVSSFSNPGVYAAGVGLFFDVTPGTSLAVKRLGAAMPDSSFSGALTVQLYEVTTATVLATVTFDSSDTPEPVGILYQWFKPVSDLILGSGSYAVVQYGGSYANVPVDYTINTLGGAVTHVLSRWTLAPGGPGHLPTQNDGDSPKYAGPAFEAQVSGAPGITQPPQGGAFVPGATATLTVTAGGSGPLSYQWQKNGQNISGATNPTLSLGPLGSADTGDYRVIVSNAFGSATSAAARIEVAGTPTVDVQMNPGIVIHGTVGLHYRVEWRDALTPGSEWQLLEDVPSLPTPVYVVIDPAPTSATNKRFYQAILVP